MSLFMHEHLYIIAIILKHMSSENRILINFILIPVTINPNITRYFSTIYHTLKNRLALNLLSIQFIYLLNLYIYLYEYNY